MCVVCLMCATGSIGAMGAGDATGAAGAVCAATAIAATGTGMCSIAGTAAGAASEALEPPSCSGANSPHSVTSPAIIVCSSASADGITRSRIDPVAHTGGAAGVPPGAAERLTSCAG